jgi:hypothetical protein
MFVLPTSRIKKGRQSLRGMLNLFNDYQSVEIARFRSFMKPSPNFPEKRQTFRWQVTGPRQVGELRLGEHRFKVQLADESAGGFRAICDQPINVPVGVRGLLCAGGDWFEVRVANIEALKSSPLIDQDDGKPLPADYFQTPAKEENKPDALPDQPPTYYRLGLVRLRDTFNPDIKYSYYSWAGLSCQMRNLGSSTLGIVVLGIALASIVVFIPFTAVQILAPDAGESEFRKGIQWVDRQAAAAKKEQESSKYSLQQNKKIAELRQTIAHMPGAIPFALPDVIKHLQLTPSQQKQIQELTDSATQAIRNLDHIAVDSTAKTQDILKTTRNKILEILDNNQKKKWHELTGQPGKEASK